MVENALHGVFDRAASGLCLITLGGRLVQANPSLAAILGYEDAAALMASVKDVGRDMLQSPELFAGLLSTLYSNGAARLSRVQALHSQGQVCWVCLDARLLRPEDLVPGGGNAPLDPLVLLSVSDITEPIALADHALRENQHYKSLYENTAEALFLCGASGELLLGNHALARLLGYGSFQELKEHQGSLPGLLLEPARFQHLLGELDSEACASRFEAQVMRRGGGSVWVGISANLAHDHAGQAALIHGAIHDITEQKNLETRLLREGYRDALTGLANRSMFLNLLDKSLARARRRDNYSFALVALTLDSFRVIKQSLGRGVAEAALTSVAGALVEALRTEDICARLGTSEFGLLLSDVFSPADAVRVIERINQRLDAPLRIMGHDVYAHLSFGVVLHDKRYQSSEAMLDDADTAMHRAKADSVHSFAVFIEEMQHQATARLQAETDLRKALEQREFSLFFQPIISVRRGEITALEALMRWERPNIGIVPPDRFISLLEETALILPAGKWVLREACRQLKEWQETFPKHADLAVSVNLSPRQLEHDTLFDDIQEALLASGLRPQCLTLEITEALFIAHPERALEKLLQIKEFGVSISIDDFGTGYSSLAYLHRIPADTLKIDKSFIHAMRINQDGETIVRAIVALAHSLGKCVVAEGVETSQQLSYLMQLQCEYVQGYYFSKPLPPPEIKNLIERGLEP